MALALLSKGVASLRRENAQDHHPTKPKQHHVRVGGKTLRAMGGRSPRGVDQASIKRSREANCTGFGGPHLHRPCRRGVSCSYPGERDRSPCRRGPHPSRGPGVAAEDGPRSLTHPAWKKPRGRRSAPARDDPSALPQVQGFVARNSKRQGASRFSWFAFHGVPAAGFFSLHPY